MSSLGVEGSLTSPFSSSVERTILQIRAKVSPVAHRSSELGQPKKFSRFSTNLKLLGINPKGVLIASLRSNPDHTLKKKSPRQKIVQ